MSKFSVPLTMPSFLILLILFIFSNSVNAAVEFKSANVPNETVYGNTKYPFGDENQFNIDALDSDANKVHCVEQKDIKELEGHCPLKQPTDEVSDPYIACPGYDTIPPPNEILYTSNERPSPEIQCKKCDLRLTTDNKAVIVECFQCYDIPSPSREEASRTEKNILYKVYHLAVANYTSVEVTGSEYF